MNLKDFRTIANLSQSQLAKLSDTSVRMIQKYETGEKDINKAQAITVYKLSKVLDCNMEDLLELKNTP